MLMDPLSALGLAAAIVQFAAFSTSIIKTLTSAAGSASGFPSELANLDDAYSKLSAQSQRLETAHRNASRSIEQELEANPSTTTNRPAANPTWDDHYLDEFSESLNDTIVPTLLESYQNLKALLARCSAECSKMMEIVTKIKAHQKSGSPWSRVRAAVNLVLKKEEIDRIEECINKCGNAVLNELCNISVSVFTSPGKLLTPNLTKPHIAYITTFIIRTWSNLGARAAGLVSSSPLAWGALSLP